MFQAVIPKVITDRHNVIVRVVCVGVLINTELNSQILAHIQDLIAVRYNYSKFNRIRNSCRVTWLILFTEAVVNKTTDSQKQVDVGSDDEDDGDDVEQGLEGSADQPLDF